MSFRLRLILVLLAIYSIGGYFLLHRALTQVRPRYLESMEESLVDVAVLLASVLESSPGDGPLDVTNLAAAVTLAQSRQFDARIFSLRKTSMDLRVYVVDARGRLVFSSTGDAPGADFSQWNDVVRTLRGEYGARSTRDVPNDDHTQVLYVAAPIRVDGQIAGAITVGKPTRGINELVEAARRRLVLGAVMGGVLLLAALLVVASWAAAPLEKLTLYARRVRDGDKVARPRLPGRTLRDLGEAFEQMRDALEGRQHAERYTQALAHEVKAPLAAIRGAAELMEEDMPLDQRRKFLGNIRSEAARIQQIIDRLLELSSIEARKSLSHRETLSAGEVASEAMAAVAPAFAAREVQLVGELEPLPAIEGDRVLLREAVVNLLQNALDFAPGGSVVRLHGRVASGRLILQVEDEGPGVPDYALARVFDRFYSLPRPRGGRKSTGLGLTLVREIAHLHQGEVVLENRPERGARAILWLPIAPS